MTEMKKEGRRVFGAVETTEENAGQDWRATPREELLKQAIVALDGAKMEADEAGDENYVRHVDAVLFPFLETELKKATGETDSIMTKEERARYDARANEEAWGFAVEILEPWMEVTRLIGSDELTRVMEKAQDEAAKELNRALDVLERLQGEQA